MKSSSASSKGDKLFAFEEKLKGRPVMRYDEFIEWSLYDSVIGYYQQKRQRVGKQSTCDFYTSRNIGKLWGELILSSCLKILGSDHIADYCFVEIACEPDRETLMKEHSHPFKSIHSICFLAWFKK